MALVTVTADLTGLRGEGPANLTQNPVNTLNETFFFGGKLRCEVIKVRQAATAGDVIRVRRNLPRCVVLPMSYVYRAGGTVSSLTLDIGYQEHTDLDGNVTGGDIDALADGLDVAAAGTDTNWTQLGSGKLIDTKDGWDLLISPLGANIVAATELDIVLFYLVK